MKRLEISFDNDDTMADDAEDDDVQNDPLDEDDDDVNASDDADALIAEGPK